MKIWFVSGHLDLTPDEFSNHYAGRIVAAFQAGDRFVLGDAPGCDTMAQQLLADLGAEGPQVTVFHMLERPRELVSGFALVGGYKTDLERDEAMTRCSDDDIAWVRPVHKKKNSGTAKNLRRRFESVRAERRTWPRYIIGEDYSGTSVRLYLRDPKEEPAGVHERLVPVPPGLYERYIAARDEHFKVQQELRRAQVAAEVFKDEGAAENEENKG